MKLSLPIDLLLLHQTDGFFLYAKSIACLQDLKNRMHQSRFYYLHLRQLYLPVYLTVIDAMLFCFHIEAAFCVSVSNNSSSVISSVFLARRRCSHKFQLAVSVESVPKRMEVFVFNSSICAVHSIKNNLKQGTIPMLQMLLPVLHPSRLHAHQ